VVRNSWRVVGYRNIILFIVPHNFNTNNLIGCVNLFRLVHVASYQCRRLVAILLTECQEKEICTKFNIERVFYGLIQQETDFRQHERRYSSSLLPNSWTDNYLLALQQSPVCAKTNTIEYPGNDILFLGLGE